MYKDEVLNGIEDMQIYIKEMRDNDLSYNEEQREKIKDKIQAYHTVLIKDMNWFDYKKNK